MAQKLRPGDALLLVDVQNDFCPGGALPVPAGDEVVGVLNRWIEAATQAGIPVFASQDWHPPGHVSFAEQGGPWPAHCVQGTRGAEFHPELRLPADTVIVRKGNDREKDSYSAFDGTALSSNMAKLGVKRVWHGGLALDYCVRASALDALAEGFDTHVIVHGTRAVNVRPGDGEAALEEMRRAGAKLSHGE